MTTLFILFFFIFQNLASANRMYFSRKQQNKIKEEIKGFQENDRERFINYFEFLK